MGVSEVDRVGAGVGLRGVGTLASPRGGVGLHITRSPEWGDASVPAYSHQLKEDDKAKLDLT